MSFDEFIIKRRPNWLMYAAKYLDCIINEEYDIGCRWSLDLLGDCGLSTKELKKRYPSRNLFCFAKKIGTDDIACWEEGNVDKVFIVHDFASPGWERRQIFEDFNKWYQWALEQDEFD
jgi:hypothetical protein